MTRRTLDAIGLASIVALACALALACILRSTQAPCDLDDADTSSAWHCAQEGTR